MPRPTFNPRGILPGNAIIDSTVTPTQTSTAVERQVSIVSLGITPAGGQIPVIFRAPPSGATITAVRVCAGATIVAAATEADTYSFMVKNRTTGNNLQSVGGSLSDVTLAATAWKTLNLNNGNNTVLSGHTLALSMGVSGSPAAMQHPKCIVEWTPYSNS